MLHAGAGGHVLNLARADDAAIAHRILVLQRAAEDVGDDFHVPMRMRSETHPRHDEIIVDDAQAAEADPLWVVIIREAEGVIGVEPSVFGVPSFICFSYFHHGKTVPQDPPTWERPCFLPQHNQRAWCCLDWCCGFQIEGKVLFF